MRSLCLFVVAGILAMSAARAAGQNLAKQVPADPKGEVDITNVAGTVEVTGWDRPSVDVQGSYDSGVQRVDVLTQGSHTIVKVVPAPRFIMHDTEARLRIQVPSASAIEVNAVSSDFRGVGLSGPQRLKTVSGDVQTTIGSGDLDVKTISGNVSLRGGENSANLRIQTVSGDVTIEHGAGSLEAITVSGGVSAQLAPAKTVRVRSTSGNLKFDGRLTADATLDAETISGDLAIGGGSENGFQYDVSTFNGDIHSCFRTESSGGHKGALPGSTLNGAVGQGGARVRLKTMNGDVSLCDR